jgi:hypothetical protein
MITSYDLARELPLIAVQVSSRVDPCFTRRQWEDFAMRLLERYDIEEKGGGNKKGESTARSASPSGEEPQPV